MKKMAEILQTQAEVEEEIKRVERRTYFTEADRQKDKERLKSRYIDNLKQQKANVAAVERVISSLDRRQAQTHEQVQKLAEPVHIAVTEVLTAVKKGLIELTSNRSKAVLTRLADTITVMDSIAASSLHPFVDKYIDKAITLSDKDQPKTDFEKEYDDLVKKDPVAAVLLRNCLLESATELGKTKEGLEKKFEDPLKKVSTEFDYDWEQAGLNIFFDEDDQSLLNILYSTDSLWGLLKEMRQQKTEEVMNGVLQREYQTLAPAEKEKIIDQLASREIEDRIILLFGKILKLLDEAKTSELFDKIVQTPRGGSYMQASILSVYSKLTARLEQQIEKINKQASQITFNLYEKFSEEEFATVERDFKVKDKQGNEITVTKKIAQYRVTPTPSSRPVESPADFLRSIRRRIHELWEVREYTHNVKYLYRMPAGKEGFWGQMAGYAEKMQSADIDTLILFPDSDIFMTAHNLYVKYLEETFAQFNWIHQPNMFTEDIGSIRNKIEQRVLENIKVIFKERIGKETWRYNYCMSMAVGLAKGVFLTEPEIAADADTPLTQEGDTTFTSYYGNDNAALNALNFLHTAMRFKPDSLIRGSLFFSSISGKKQKLTHWWNHRDLWEKMQRYQKSFIQGYEAFEGKEESEELFVERLPNMGHVGSTETRSAWRQYYAYEGWLQYKEKAQLDYLQSWKALENIGYEVLLEFVRDKVDQSFLEKQTTERDDFFEDILRVYIKPNTSSADYKNNLRKKIVAGIDEKIKKGEIKKEERNKKIEIGVHQKMLYAALAGVIRNRIPTKFIRIERDRMSKDGERAWQKTLEASTLKEEDFDRAINDLLIVETIIRQETSDAMKKHLITKKLNEVKTLNDFSTDNYVVNEDVIDHILKGLHISDNRIQQAKKVFTIVNKDYCQDVDFMDTFAHKIEHKAFHFAIGSEELDRSFLAYRNAGGRVLAREVGDTAKIEQGFAHGLTEYIGVFHPTAISGKHDISELVKHLGQIKDTVESIHGDYGYEVAYNLATFAIAYFKKDTRARNIFTKWFVVGEPHSLAARFSGTARGVWEWNVRDIDHFITELEKHHILPKDPYNLTKGNPERLERSKLKLPFLKKQITFPPLLIGRTKMKREPDFKFYGKLLRQEVGATKLHVGLEILGNYGPLVLLVVLYEWLSKAWKETQGEKQ